MPVREVSASPTQHGEGRDEGTWERPEGAGGTASGEATRLPAHPHCSERNEEVLHPVLWASVCLQGEEIRTPPGGGVTWDH